MSTSPLVSFIIPSYNYARYIGQTIQSAIDQTYANLEIIVIDDCSTDGSRDIIRSFKDKRLHVIFNEHNLGGSESFNRAYSQVKGKYIVNLDSDDWIEPEKTSRQIELVTQNPKIEIVGTWINVVDQEGNRHPEADQVELAANQDWDFNLTETWVARNALCRSSTLVSHSFHERCGTFDTVMKRAPDYDLWTRALHEGLRFALIPEKLTNYRLHQKGVTHADPRGTLLELTYSMVRNLIPVVEARATLPCLSLIFRWVVEHPVFAELTARQRYRIIAFVVGARRAESFAEFQAWVLSTVSDPASEQAGKTVLVFSRYSAEGTEIDRLRHDIGQYIEARDWWMQQSKNRELLLSELRQQHAREVSQKDAQLATLAALLEVESQRKARSVHRRIYSFMSRYPLTRSIAARTRETIKKLNS